MNLAIAFGRDDDLCTAVGELVHQMVRIIALVRDGSVGVDTVDQIVGEGDVVTLAGGANQAQRQTERFGGDMDFGAQAAARPTQALGIRPPLTLRAPAACWWARTMVESIISHSRSASQASAASISSSTPISIQR